MKKRYKVYKVLSTYFGNKLVSSDVQHRDWRLTYAPGRKTRAKPGSVGIFVFTMLEDAYDYTSSRNIHEAWTETEPQEIKWIGSYDTFWRYPAFCLLFASLLKMSFFRRLQKANAGELWLCPAPKGCHVVPEITLGERVAHEWQR